MQTKDTLIKYLRGFLINKDNYGNFCEEDFTDCQIFDKEPNRLRKFPTILITSANGNFITAGLGDMAQELYDEHGDLAGYRYSGMLELPITMEIAVKNTRTRDVLVDLITIAFRVLLRRHLEAVGILVKDMRYTGENEIEYDSDKIYIATIQFTTWSEWYRDISLLPFKDININIDMDMGMSTNVSK